MRAEPSSRIHCGCKAVKWEAVLNAQLGHITASLQICPQHTSEMKNYMPRTKAMLLSSREPPFTEAAQPTQDAFVVRRKEGSPAEREGYEPNSRKFCNGQRRHRNAALDKCGTEPQRTRGLSEPSKELDCVSVVWLVKVLPYSVIVVDGDGFLAQPAWKNLGMKGLSALDTVRDHARLRRKGYSLLDRIRFLRDFKPRCLKQLSASVEKRPESVPEKACSDMLSAEGDGTEKCAAPK